MPCAAGERPHLADLASRLEHARRPAELEGAPLIGSFGNVNASKRIRTARGVRAAAVTGRTLGSCSSVPSRPASTSTGCSVGLSDQGIVREAYVEEARLWALMAACDVCVNLRSPTMGETSGSVIRQLSRRNL